MFAKKFLSFVSLLCIGKLVSAGRVLGDCPGGKSSSATTSLNTSSQYCLSGTNIRDIGSDGSEDNGILTEGVYVFDQTTQKAIELGSGGVIGSSAENLVLYQCDANKDCVQTVGYVLIGSTQFYYVTDSASNTADVDDAVESINDCDGTNAVGTLINFNSGETRLCLTTTKSVAGNTSGDYLIFDSVTSGATQPFSQYNSIITTSNYFIVDKLLTGDDYCADDDGTMKIGIRTEMLCSTEGCDTFYKCTEGLCTPATADNSIRQEGVQEGACSPSTSTNCGTNGYYLTTNGDALITSVTAEDASNKLYNCNGGSCALLSSDDQIPDGIIPNADPSSKADVPYIYCIGTVCKGLIKASMAATCVNNAGKLIFSENYKLCVDSTDTNAVTIAAGAEGDYLVDINNAALFIAATESKFAAVTISVSDNTILLKTGTVSGKYITDANHKLLAEDVEGKNVFSCSNNVNCDDVTVTDVATTGYYLNAGAPSSDAQQYIQCKNGKCYAYTAAAKTCSSGEEGNIVKDGGYKLCLSGTKDVELKDSNTSDNGQYLVDAGITNILSSAATKAGYEFYFVMEVTDTDAVVVTGAINKFKYRYAMDNDLKIHTKDTTICGANEDTFQEATAKEYKYDGDIDSIQIYQAPVRG